MAMIGGRIRQVLRILHTDGLCSGAEIYGRMQDDTLLTRPAATKYLQRAVHHGLARKHPETWPARYSITAAGVELVTGGSDRRAVERTKPRGPASVWELAGRAA